MRLRSTIVILVIAISTSPASLTLAADEKIPGSMKPEDMRAAGYSPLSEDDSLDAWNVKPWHKGHWTIKEGVINYDGKAGGKKQDKSLWTKKSYGDILMYAEWRLPATPKLKPTPI